MTKGDPDSVGITWVSIPAGTFDMGVPEDSTYAKSGANNQNWPQVAGVSVSGFNISAYEVTNAQYVQYLNEAYELGEVYRNYEDSEWQRDGGWEVRGSDNDYSYVLYDGVSADEDPINRCYIDFNETSDQFYLENSTVVADWPVVYIRYHGAAAFAEFYGMQLPTNAQWEYAARAGDDSAWYATSTGDIDYSLCNYRDPDNEDDWTGKVMPVGSYAPNPWGLYDMCGNVWEWAYDWHCDPYYSFDVPTQDPAGPILDPPLEDGTETGGPGQPYSGSTRDIRGGAYNYHTAANLLVYRRGDYPYRGNDHFGMRVVKSGPTPEPIEYEEPCTSSTSEKPTKPSFPVVPAVALGVILAIIGGCCYYRRRRKNRDRQRVPTLEGGEFAMANQGGK